jgi:hypothetical protein
LPLPKDVKIDADKSSAHTHTQPLPQKQTGSAAGLPYLETAGLTCRSAPILGTRSNASLLKKTIRGKPEVFHPVSRFVHGCKLLAI